MTLSEMLRYGREQLADKIPDSSLDAWYLLEYVMKIDRGYFLMHPDQEAEASQEQQYMELLEKRSRHIPLQHLTGVQEFMGLEFLVSKDVLIPRQDTEVLVETAERYIRPGMHILDMCTGSGCILISLMKRNRGTRGTGADISEKALAVARKNAARQGVEPIFVQSDLYQAIDGGYDMIVSNPPYIPSIEIEGLMEEVRIHDPLMALDGGTDGLDFYREIICEGRKHLSKGGYMLLEIGCKQGNEVSRIFRENGYFEIEVVKDLAGLDRVVTACTDASSTGGKYV